MNNTNKGPLVSVIMPAYNSETHISEAIESILNQTYGNIELIVIDDGSIDGTASIVKELATKDSRIRFVSRENKGIAVTLNEAVSMAVGKYVARMDSDDKSLPNRLDEQVAFLEEHSDISICGGCAYVNNTKKMMRVPFEHKKIETYVFLGSPFIHPTVMWRKYDFDANGLKYDPTFASEDYELWSRTVLKCKCANLDKPLIHYRIDGNNISIKNKSKLLESNQRIREVFCVAKNVLYGLDAPLEAVSCNENALNNKEVYYEAVLSLGEPCNIALEYILNNCYDSYVNGIHLSTRHAIKRFKSKFGRYYKDKKVSIIKNMVFNAIKRMISRNKA